MNDLPKELAATFDRIKAAEGEEAYNKARIGFIRSYGARPGASEVLPDWFPDLDVKAILESNAPQQESPLRSLMPTIKTKTQEDVTLICFEALKAVLDGCFSGNLVSANMAKDTLEKALGVAFQASEIQEKLKEVPVEQRGPKAQEFVAPVTQDAEIVDILLKELEGIRTMGDLQVWYSESSDRRNLVTKQDLRDHLYDAIRAKRSIL